MSHSLNSLKRVFYEIIQGTVVGLSKRHTRSLDHGSSRRSL